MKAIILAAGEGRRLRPLTDDRPKCMVAYRGTPILEHILGTMRSCGISDITVVTGYRADRIDYPDIAYRTNERYGHTNMVATLFCAEDDLQDDDIILSYSDIVYRADVLQTLIDARDALCIVVDRAWKHLWQRRMPDPLADAETMKIDSSGFIRELGKKPLSYQDIDAQYIGLIKLRANVLEQIKVFYHSLDRDAIYDGQPFEKMYMTSFIQCIIDRLMPARAVPIDGGWIEVDSPEDLDIELDWVTCR